MSRSRKFLLFSGRGAAAVAPLISAGPTYTPGASPAVTAAATSNIAGKMRVEFIRAWAAATVEVADGTANSFLMPTVYNGHAYEVTVAGTTGAVEPTWPTIDGNTVTLDGVTYTCRALAYAWFSEEADFLATVHSVVLNGGDGILASHLYHARVKVTTALGGVSAWSSDGTFTAAAAAASYSAEATTLFAAMSSAPDATRKGHIDDLIVALKAAGAWTKMDYFYIFAAHAEQAATLDWKNPANLLYEGTNAAFTVDRGYAGDGAAEELLSAPQVDSTTQFTQNSAHFGAWMETAVADGDHLVGDRFFHAAGRYMRRDGASIACKLNSGTETFFTTTPTTGHFVASRPDASNQNLYKNGVSIGAQAAASTAPPAEYIAFGRVNGGFSGGRIAGWHIGANLAAEAAAVYSALRTYMTAVGVA